MPPAGSSVSDRQAWGLAAFVAVYLVITAGWGWWYLARKRPWIHDPPSPSRWCRAPLLWLRAFLAVVGWPLRMWWELP